MSQQLISYGNAGDVVSFPYARLDSSHEPVYAPNGITVEGTRYEFTVRGTIVGNSLDDFAARVCAMRRVLVKPRQDFSVIWVSDAGAQTWLYAFNTGGDVMWGPIPKPLRLTRFSGGISCAYEWSVVVTVKECLANVNCADHYVPTQPSNDVLSVTERWDHRVDMNGLTTRTVSGKLVITSDAIKRGNSADGYRESVEPVMQGSFKVIARDYAQSDDGRELAYAISMQEVNYTLPLPLTGGDASFTIRLSATGLMAYFSLSGFFEAPWSVDKSVILGVINTLLNAKLGPYLLGSNPAIFENQELTTPAMYEKNRVDFSFSGTFAIQGDPLNTTMNIYSGLKPQLVSAPPNGNGLSNPPGMYGGDGTADSGVIAGLPYYLHDACSENLTPTDSGIATSTSPGAETRGANDDTLSNSGCSASAAHLAAPYVAYHEEVHYSLDNGIEVYVPKQASLAPITQQSRPPTMTIIQAGYQVRYASTVEAVTKGVPDPIGDQTNRTILSAEIIPSSPEPVGDGAFSRWTTHWRYVMKVILAYTSSDTPAGSALGIDYPKDPRRAALATYPVQRTTNVLLVDPTTFGT